jgi:2-amino-4-hydroxy-6-hydroxymethyldihydropteridine diphosphokinase
MNQRVFILHLGSNCGERQSFINEALRVIQQNTGNLENESCLYETAPWGGVEQDDFLNLAVSGTTSLSPFQLYRVCADIENQIARPKREPWGPRELDIDCIFHGDSIIGTDELVLPHPRAHLRRFVLQPIADIAPEFMHPVIHQNISTLLANCKDPLRVEKYQNNK